MRWANAGSPTQPSASDDMVMPSWDHGDIGIELEDTARCSALALTAALGNHFFHPAAAYRDQGKFRCNEETIGNDEADDARIISRSK